MIDCQDFAGRRGRRKEVVDVVSPELGRIIRAAIRSWPETLRFCLIVVVVAAMATLSLYFVKSSALLLFMR